MQLLILGASTRAAAASARRSGIEPWSIDMFADVDTQRLGPCLSCPFEQYPVGLFRLAANTPPMPWMYTGGLENFPELVTQLATERPLWGNPAAVLHSVRDPATLAQLGTELDFATPRLLASDMPLSQPGRWLQKPIAGSGGFGIHFVTDATTTATPSAEPHRFVIQEFITGRSLSAMFASNATDCELIGISEQLHGESFLHAKPFAFCGNIGPIAVDDTLRTDISTIGTRLARRTGLVGIWGIDFILHGTTPYIIEVNPRYTASVEVYELSSPFRSFDWLQWTFAGAVKPTMPSLPENATPLTGKAVYYAPVSFTMPHTGPLAEAFQESGYADIPQPGSIIVQGQPVVTMLTAAPDSAACRHQLQRRAAQLDRLLPRD